MQFTVYSNTGKSAVYPLLLDVTSDIIGQLKGFGEQRNSKRR